MTGSYVEIYNVIGRKVKSMEVREAKFLLLKDNLPTGVYTIKLIGKNNQFAKRFIIQ